ncbi:MAG: Ig-like domain-containing protein [Desulfotomaculaceae bacterium]
MKVKKSLRAIALALVVVFVLSSTAFAAIPNNTIIFNDKAYDLSLLDDPSMVNEILGAFVANHNTFIYKTPTGTFLNNNGNVVNSGVLPAVTYKDVNKNTTPYNAQDGDPVVQSVSITAITVDPAAVTVDNGTSKDVAIAQLSAKVTLTLSDNTTKDVDVTWDCATYDGAKAGDYAFNGTFTLPGGVTNPDAKVATAKVTVKDATVDLTATADVTKGAMSFKDINVKSCQGIDGAAKFKVAGSSLVNSFGTAIRVMNGNPTVGISILAANGTTVLATGSVDISKTSVTDLTVNLQ